VNRYEVELEKNVIAIVASRGATAGLSFLEAEVGRLGVESTNQVLIDHATRSLRTFQTLSARVGEVDDDFYDRPVHRSLGGGGGGCSVVSDFDSNSASLMFRAAVTSAPY
tara:strand:+ start:1086 stop:1415 length:330 start_codon:yes stop_codon:yes gene_type:complete